MTVRFLIWVVIALSIATYNFYPFLPKGSYYIGNAIFIFVLTLIIWRQNRNLFVSFFLLCIASSNLLDELFFNPQKLGLNEILIALILPFIYYVRKISKYRTLHIFNKNYIPRFFSNRSKNSHRDEKK